MFKSFWQAGFECATQTGRDGRRLDVVGETQHDRWVMEDYRRLAAQGIYTVREGARWHVIEKSDGDFNFESVDSILKAAEETGIELIWDLLHFGWPTWLDVFSSEWVEAFDRFVSRFLQHLKSWKGTLAVIPVNEVSFLSWAGGEVAYICPFCQGRASELKEQLVRAFIRAAETLRADRAGTVIIAVDPKTCEEPSEDGISVLAQENCARR